MRRHRSGPKLRSDRRSVAAMLRTRLDLAPPPHCSKRAGGPCLSAAREVTRSLGSRGWPVDNDNRHSAVDSESTHTVSESRRSMIPEPVSMRSMMNSKPLSVAGNPRAERGRRRSTVEPPATVPTSARCLCYIIPYLYENTAPPLIVDKAAARAGTPPKFGGVAAFGRLRSTCAD